MTAPANPPPLDPVQAAYLEGRRIGLASAALALSVVAYINLLGVEKSILAIVLAILSLRGTASAASALRRSRTALILAAVHVITFIVVLVMFHDKLIQLIHLLQKLS